MSNTDIKSSDGVPSCKKVIPIYPVRYAVMPSKKAEYLYAANKSLKQDFATLHKASYCLRSLRKNAYVYIYDPDARHPWSCFYIDEQGFYRRNIDKNTGKLTRADNKPFTYIYADAHEHKPKKVYIGYTDSPYTKKIMEGVEVEGGKLKATIMQEIDLGTWTDAADANWKATKTPLSKAPSVKHTFLTNELEKLNLDYSTKYNTHWSEEEGLTLNIGNIKAGQVGANKKLQLTVALYDAVGIASELSHLVGLEVANFNHYLDANSRKAWVSSIIDELSEKAGWRAFHHVQMNNTMDALMRSGVQKGGALDTERAATYKQEQAAQASKISVFKSYGQEVKRKAFMVSYEKEVKALKKAIEVAGKDHTNFLCNYAEGGLFQNLMSYDPEDNFSFIGLRSSFARCIDGLPASKAGIDFAKTQLDPNNPTDMFYIVMLGNPVIRKYIEIKDDAESDKAYINVKGYVNKARDAFVDMKLAALNALLEEIPADEASKTISRVIMSSMLSSGAFPPMASFMKSVYPSTLEAFEGVLSNVKSMSLEDLIEQVHQSKTTAKPHFRYTTNPQLLKQPIKVHVTQAVAPTPEQVARRADVLQRTKFWANVKIGISGLGTALGAFSTYEAFAKLNRDDRNVLVNSIGLSTSALATTSGVVGVRQVIYEKRGSLAAGDNAKAKYKGLADKFERRALGLLALAAIMAGIKDVVLAANTSNKKRQAAYIGAAGAQMTIAGIATYQLTTKLAEAGNQTAVRIVSSKAVKSSTEFFAKTAARVLGRFTPTLFVASLIIEAIAYGLETYAEAHDDDEILEWISHSIWGTNPDKSWDDAKEKYELNRLYITPKVKKLSMINWSDFQVILPGYNSQTSDYTVKKGSTKLKGVLTDKKGIAVVTFKDIENWGDIVVDYWPDKNKQDIKYSVKE